MEVLPFRNCETGAPAQFRKAWASPEVYYPSDFSSQNAFSIEILSTPRWLFMAVNHHPARPCPTSNWSKSKGAGKAGCRAFTGICRSNTWDYAWSCYKHATRQRKSIINHPVHILYIQVNNLILYILHRI